MELIEKFYWIDLVSIILFLRIGYISFRHGFLNESVKLLGIILASFFSLQYYSSFLADVFTKKPFYFNRENLNFISFIIIFVVISFLFSLIRRFFFLLSKKENFNTLEKIFSLGLGLIRAALLVSVIVFAIWINPRTSEDFSKSFSYKKFNKVVPVFYVGTFRVLKKINPRLTLIKEVVKYYEVKKNL